MERKDGCRDSTTMIGSAEYSTIQMGLMDGWMGRWMDDIYKKNNVTCQRGRQAGGSALDQAENASDPRGGLSRGKQLNTIFPRSWLTMPGLSVKKITKKNVQGALFGPLPNDDLAVLLQN